jgi:hypothetical protein
MLKNSPWARFPLLRNPPQLRRPPACRHGHPAPPRARPRDARLDGPCARSLGPLDGDGGPGARRAVQGRERLRGLDVPAGAAGGGRLRFWRGAEVRCVLGFCAL